MKKRKIVTHAIIVVIVIAGMIVNIYMNKKDHFSKSTVKEIPQTDLAFAVLGDVHENIDSFQEVIDDLYTINPGMDALVLNGDAVDQGLEKQYNSVKSTIDKNKMHLIVI